MTPTQLKIIHIAAHRCGFNDQQYRTVLRNVAQVESSKDLSNADFECVMAFFEESGYPGHYWRDKVKTRGNVATERMRWKISELLAHYEEIRGELPHYELEGLVARFSHNRTRKVADVTPREAWQLIEALKAIIARVEDAAPAPATAAGEAPF
ncbi:MAG TPA: phage protein GemA/Gp16 family protein [Phycisphaerae bacterium]|nr:phage protein GemA/Gp16 family protein [Phycisphaerae bacterium]